MIELVLFGLAAGCAVFVIVIAFLIVGGRG
jgi:hypothetical protein